jgi:thiol-disulfide isomerase/thioredoxin
MLRALIIWMALSTAALADAIPAGFNDEGIKWLAVDEGLKQAAETDKPILLVVHATWCPQCREFSKQFFDARVEAFGEDVIFVLIDGDQERDAANTYAFDGKYVPRTMVLGADGALVPDINSQRDDFRYFLDTRTPDDLLRVLTAARDLP